MQIRIEADKHLTSHLKDLAYEYGGKPTGIARKLLTSTVILEWEKVFSSTSPLRRTPRTKEAK